MIYGKQSSEFIPIKSILLDQDNPRHKPLESQTKVIEALCEDDYVFELAKDIASHGLNPLELFALIPNKSQRKNRYIVTEGNRRFCAILLLNDPDLAPAKIRKSFENLSDAWTPVSKVLSIVFKDREDVKLWLDRMHGGLHGGIGRKQWNSEQKARNTGNSKNYLAQQVLDYAQGKGYISEDDRKGKISTVQRFLANAIMRESLGIDAKNTDEIFFFRPRKDFDLLVKKFIGDIRSKEINTRKNKDEIVEYSRELQSIEGFSGKTISPTPLHKNSGSGEPQPRKKIRVSPPKRPNKLYFDGEVHRLLKKTESYKLEKLYYSLCSIELEDHTPLLSVCAWSFIETLTAKDGKSVNTDFYSYLSKKKLADLGLGKGKEQNGIREAVNRMKEHGNITKHDHTSANFNGEQLANDFETLTPLFRSTAESIAESK